MQVIKKGIVKTVLWTTLLLFVVLVLLIGALQLPYFQTKLVQNLSLSISEKIGFPVSIGHVNLKWFDILVLDKVEIRDFKDNEMIYVHQLSVDFNLTSLIDDSDINLDQVNLDIVRVNLIRNTNDEDLNINLFIKRIRQLVAPKNPSKKRKTPVFSIEKVFLDNAYFSLNDPLEDSITNRFDYYHFDVSDIHAEINNLKVIADTFEIDIQNIIGINKKNDLKINEMKTFFRVSESSMEFTGLDLSVGESHIMDSVVFLYDEMADLNHFNDSVHVKAKLQNTIINSKDLAVFAPLLHSYNDEYIISGNFDGRVSKFNMKDLKLSFGINSSLDGSVSFDGLPNIQETFMEIQLNNSAVNAFDVRKYITENDYQKIKKFGQVNFYGQFLGFANDFVANGTFLTDLGRVVSDINLKLEPENRNSTYQGNLATYNFDLGRLLEMPETVQKIDFSGNINGKGLTIENADLKVKAQIKKLGIKGYEYTNIVTNARFAKELFEGKLSIEDPNLKFSADASIDLRNSQNIFKIKAQLDTAILKPLLLTKEEAFFSAKLDLNIEGNKIDDIVGDAYFSDASLSYKGKELQVDYLNLISKKDENNRYVHLDSELVKLSASGNFDYTPLSEDISRLVKEYTLNFLNEEEDLEEYYKKKNKRLFSKYSLDYEITLNNVNPLIQLFEDELYIGLNTQLEGNFTSGYTSIFSVRSTFDTLIYKKSEFYNNEVDVTTSKIADSTNVLAAAYLFSTRQQHQKITQTENLVFEGVWSNDHIDFSTMVAQAASSNKAHVFGELEFLKDRTEIKFHDSEFSVLEKIWKIREDNKIILDNGEIAFENLKIFYDDQNIAINGTLTDSLNKVMNVTISKFQLELINPLLNQKFSGIVNGSLDVTNGLGDFILESELNVKDFKVDKFLVGDITGISTWDKDLDRLNLALDVFRVDRKTVDIKGTFTPSEKVNQLDLGATFDQTNLNILEPFTDGNFSNIAGVASGQFTITGHISSPILKGNGNIEGGRFTINYLNTHYTFNGRVLFDENEIGVRNLNVYDDGNNLALVNGGVFHDGFKNFVLDLRSELNNFKVLNTTIKDNSLYYGTAIVSGKLNILGDLNNLDFNASAVSNKGTKIFIPISNSTGVEQKDFINFVNFKDTATLGAQNRTEKINLNRIKLNFDLDITPDAYCEIIFDIKSGDIIRGRGYGKLNLEIDTKGDFNMFGDYEISEGGYNFTLYNIINKEFKIQKGSKITWYGDPYHAVLDINAAYEQLASLAPLMSEPQLEENISSQVRRKYPAKVLLFLKGDLMSPDINFDINVVNYPENASVTETPGAERLGDLVNKLKFRIASDKTELERQVFSLIILRRFSSENSFTYDGVLTNSVSELLSNQLSYWVTQFDENLEIDVDLGGLDADAFNTFQLRLAYTFLDGRLRISRDGGFTNVKNEADVSSIAGEWTVEYLLTPDGKFRAKMYNRNNYNLINIEQSNASTTAGFSLMHVESFDHLREIFKRSRSKKVSEEPKVPEEETIPVDVIIRDDEEVDEIEKKKVSQN